MRLKMTEETVSLNIDIDDLGFIKSAIAEKSMKIIEYIEERESETRIDMEERAEEEDRQLKQLRMQNERLIDHLSKIDMKKKEEEINDIEIKNFQADLEEMIEKHKPRKVGRPKGSKNAKSVDQ
jgi:NAD kinase